MRLFAAFDISENLKISASDFIRRILTIQKHGIKPIKPENMHLTLKFIGEYPESGVEPVVNALKNIHAEAAVLECCGAGYFPLNGSDPEVLWLGFKKNETVRRIHEAVDRNLFSAGIARDKTPYYPHLTLARVKKPAEPALMNLIHDYRAHQFGEMPIASFFLYKSELKKSDPVYSKIAEFQLNL